MGSLTDAYAESIIIIRPFFWIFFFTQLQYLHYLKEANNLFSDTNEQTDFSFFCLFKIPPLDYFCKNSSLFSTGFAWAVGWGDFCFVLCTCHVVVDCYGTPNPKFYFDLLLFHLAQGLKRPQKMLPVTLKSAHTKCFRSKTVFAIFEK